MNKLTFLSLGGIFTFALFVGMTYLIKPSIQEPLPMNKGLTYVPFKIDDKPPEKLIRPLPKKPELLKQPVKTRSTIPRKQPKNLASFSEQGIQFHSDGLKVAINSSAGISPWGIGSAGSGELQPSVRINPSYPIGALRDNVEGYVTLSFDISEIGRPTNVRVIDAKPRGYFEKSARKALKKWKFDPKMVKNGFGSQQVTLAFQLEKEA